MYILLQIIFINNLSFYIHSFRLDSGKIHFDSFLNKNVKEQIDQNETFKTLKTILN